MTLSDVMTKEDRQKYVESLDEWSRYDVMGAIRGCDVPGIDTEFVKVIVTARVRVIFFQFPTEVENVLPPMMLNTTVMTPEDVATVRQSQKNIPPHWRGHLRDAVFVTSGHPIWGGLGSSLFQALLP